MKKKKREFYEINGFKLFDMHELGKRYGYGRTQMDKAMNVYFDETNPEGRLPHEIRIDIARNVLEVAKRLKTEEYISTENYIETLETERFDYRQKWIAVSFLSGALFILLIAMKIKGF